MGDTSAWFTLAPLVSALPRDLVIVGEEPVVLVEPGVVEQRYRAVLGVLEGASVVEVARRNGVTRQTVHEWLRRYAGEGGLGALADGSWRPASCPHQMTAQLQATVVAMRRVHPAWGPDRIRWQLGRDGVDPLPGRSSVYRVLVRHDRRHATIEAAQAALDAWVVEDNTERPHQSCAGRPPVERFALAERSLVVEEPVLPAPRQPQASRPAGVSRWVGQNGRISLAGFDYVFGATFAGEPVEVVVTRGLVEILHAGLFVATHGQRLKPAQVDRVVRSRRAVQRRARDATVGLMVTRIVDSSGSISFAGTPYRCGIRWARQSVDVAIVAGSVQLSEDGQVIRVHPIRHDRSRELGAFANPKGRPRRKTAI